MDSEDQSMVIQLGKSNDSSNLCNLCDTNTHLQFPFHKRVLIHNNYIDYMPARILLPREVVKEDGAVFERGNQDKHSFNP